MLSPINDGLIRSRPQRVFAVLRNRFVHSRTSHVKSPDSLLINVSGLG